jgi:hypothetical protein
MTQAKQDKRPKAQPKQPKVQQVRRQRKPHPTDGWFNLGQRARLAFKEQA